MKVGKYWAKNWLSLKRPAEYSLVETVGNVATFEVQPLERGFGVTLGNALRRIMLSSLQGTAIVAVRIEGVEHPYSAIEGIREDVQGILLNLKAVVVSSEAVIEGRKSLKLKAVGPCVVNAGMIEVPNGIEIVNPETVICTLDKKAKLNASLIIATDKGYSSAETNRVSDTDITTMPMDAIFSPVVRVAYKVESTRVGADTEFDKLAITVETNGSIIPETALALSAKIMLNQLQVFTNFVEVEQEKKEDEHALPFDRILLMRVENLELSVRSQNCLKNENVVYIGDLVTRAESQMLQTPNFGKKSLSEIRGLLSKMGLKLGMEVQGWPPLEVEELARQYEEENQTT